MDLVTSSLAAILLLLVVNGCSVLMDSPDGPKPYGLALRRDVPLAAGTCRRVFSPGVSLRLLSDVWGITVGWHETLLFYPSTASVSEDDPVAEATKSFGLDAGVQGVTLGFGREFIVPQPKESHTEQAIVFHEKRLRESVVWRRRVE